MTEWAIQDAKNKFSALVNAALAGEPQRVTRRGQPAVIVIAAEEYERLCQAEKAGALDVIEHSAQALDGSAFHVPVRPENKTGVPDFIDYLLAIPQAPDDDAFELPTQQEETRSCSTRENMTTNGCRPSIRVRYSTRNFSGR